MTTKARAQFDPPSMGVSIAVIRNFGGARQVLRWQPVEVVTLDSGEGAGAEPPADHWLRLPEDDARAIYEALADYFGHSGHDVRALRRDYNDERRRVDLLISHAIRDAR